MGGIGEYELICTVGRGQFGKVKLARHRRTGLNVAVKIMRKSAMNDATLRMVHRETEIMKMLDHPHIIKLFEVIETPDLLLLVMEYAPGGEVMDFIATRGMLDEPTAVRIFSQAAFAVQYCHARKTVHRDIKAENLLLDDKLNVKLIDFGLSNVFDPNDTLKTFCGSPTYASPELVQRREYTGPEVDCWSLGVLLYVLVVGRLPFDGANYQELYTKIIRAQYTIPDHVSRLCQNLIRRMLVPDVSKRATIDEIAGHPWVLKGGCLPPKENLLNQHIAETHNIDKRILNRMEAMGMDRRIVQRSIIENRYDEFAATYFLLKSMPARQKTIFDYAAQTVSSPRSPLLEPSATPATAPPPYSYAISTKGMEAASSPPAAPTSKLAQSGGSRSSAKKEESAKKTEHRKSRSSKRDGPSPRSESDGVKGKEKKRRDKSKEKTLKDSDKDKKEKEKDKEHRKHKKESKDDSKSARPTSSDTSAAAKKFKSLNMSKMYKFVDTPECSTSRSSPGTALLDEPEAPPPMRSVFRRKFRDEKAPAGRRQHTKSSDSEKSDARLDSSSPPYREATDVEAEDIPGLNAIKKSTSFTKKLSRSKGDDASVESSLSFRAKRLLVRSKSGESTEPREVRIALALCRETKDPLAYMAEIKGVLYGLNGQLPLETPDAAKRVVVEQLAFEEISPFVIKCTDAGNRVEFDMELCRAHNKGCCGIRFRRRSGDAWKINAVAKLIQDRLEHATTSAPPS